MLNASIEGDDLVYHDDVNLGIAVALEEGLLVPVIPKAQRLSLEGIAAAIGDLSARARSKQLAPRGRPGRHVHDHEPGPVRDDPRDADHQPAAGGDPRPRGGGEAARGGRGPGRGLDRDPADGQPVPVVRPPGPRRGRRGPLPRCREGAPGTMVATMAEIWCDRARPGPYAGGVRDAEAARAARARHGAVPGRAAAARAPAGLHARAPHRRRRAADGRGLVPRPGHRGRRHRPGRPRHLPRPRPARRLSDHEPAALPRRRARVHPPHGAGDHRLARRTSASRPGRSRA